MSASTSTGNAAAAQAALKAELRKLQRLLSRLERSRPHRYSLEVWASIGVLAKPKEYRRPPSPDESMKVLRQEERAIVLMLRRKSGRHLWHPHDACLRLGSDGSQASRQRANAADRVAVQAKGGGGSPGRRQAGTVAETHKPKAVKQERLHEWVLSDLRRRYPEQYPSPSPTPAATPVLTTPEEPAPTPTPKEEHHAAAPEEDRPRKPERR